MGAPTATREPSEDMLTDQPNKELASGPLSMSPKACIAALADGSKASMGST